MAAQNTSWQARRYGARQKPEDRKKDAAILARFEELYKFYTRGLLTITELNRLLSEPLD